MRQISARSRRGTLLCVLGGAALVALAIGPQAAVAVESGESVTVYRTSNASFASAGAIEAAIADGALEPADDVTVGDALVVAIESDRLADAMDAANGSTTARFFTALDGDAAFRVIQTNPTPQANRKIAPIGPENVTVHRDGTTVYAVVETGDLAFRYRRVDRSTRIYGGERFAVQFGYDLPDDWSRAEVPSSPIVEFHPRSQPTTERPRTTSSTVASTGTRTETSTTGSSPTTRERANATGTGGGQTEASGAPGFTALTALVASLVLAALRTQRS